MSRDHKSDPDCNQWTPERLDALARSIEAGGQLWLDPHEVAIVAHALRRLARDD